MQRAHTVAQRRAIDAACAVVRPAGADELPLAIRTTATANQANCNGVVGDLTPVGSYTGSPSPYDTFDQGGNVNQWNEMRSSHRGWRELRGGDWIRPAGQLAASFWFFTDPTDKVRNFGFCVAMVPEPSTGLLVIAGLLGLAGWRRARA